MKHLTIRYYAIFLSTLCFGNAQAYNDTSLHLTERMYAFFTETLSNNFEGVNEADLYYQFLDAYFELWKNGKAFETNINVNKEKLININDELFKRDLAHYYYFYYEYQLLNPEEDLENRVKESFELFPEIPIRFYHCDENGNGVLCITETHNVMLPLEKGFISDIDDKSLKTISTIKELMENVGEVPYIFISTFFIKSDYRHELENETVRKIVAVVFWKYLCLQAGVDFHSPLEK